MLMNTRLEFVRWRIEMEMIEVYVSNKAHARRALKWLRDRSLAARYNSITKTIGAFPWKYGTEWSEQKLRDAVAATKLEEHDWR